LFVCFQYFGVGFTIFFPIFNLISILWSQHPYEHPTLYSQVLYWRKSGRTEETQLHLTIYSQDLPWPQQAQKLPLSPFYFIFLSFLLSNTTSVLWREIKTKQNYL
jgi:hypothetical protein